MSLRGQVLHSIKWLAGARLAGQIIAWVATIVVIRILDPSDYGLMAMAELMIGFATLFRVMGLHAAMVQKRNLTENEIRQCFGLLLLLNGFIYILAFATAPWFASFFEEPRLTAIIRTLAITFPITAMGVVPSAILSRHMRFRPKSLVILAATTGNGLITLMFALSGAGVWALVYGSVTDSAIRAFGMTIASRYWRLPRFSFAGMTYILRFGGFITTSHIISYISRKADVFIIGKLLGQELLGFYDIARELASIPHRKTSDVLKQVGLSAYSAEQDNMAAIRSHYLKVTRVLGLVIFPIFWGISSVSPEFVPVVLGNRWSSAIIPLQIISMVMPLRMIASTSSPPLQAIGKPHLLTIFQLIALLIMPSAFFIGTWSGGLIGASLAWAAGYPIIIMIRQHISLRTFGLTYREYLSCLTGPVFGATIMYGAVILVRYLIASPLLRPVPGLITLIFTGAIAYVSSMWFLQRQRCHELLDLAKSY